MEATRSSTVLRELATPEMAEEEDEVWLDESFFVDESYVLKSFTYGSKRIELYCLQTSSTDYDLTGQIVWPGAELFNRYIAGRSLSLSGLSVLELGSGVGLTGLLCGQYCKKVVMTDHNDKVLEVLRRNILMQGSVCETGHVASMTCEKLEWGNEEQLSYILKKHPEGFDLIVGADICYQQDSLGSLFKSVKSLLSHKFSAPKQFILAYISRAQSIDTALLREAQKQSLKVCEIPGTREISNHIFEGVLFQIQLLKEPRIHP